MVEIELSYIYSSPHDEQTLLAMMEEFTAQHRIKVRLRMMNWDTAWPEILMIVSHSSGPDVSHIGGTWVSSLAKMNALRPFKTDEIAHMGGPASFMKPIWESTSLLEDARIWSIPWTGWVYLVCYRKDLLEKARVDVQNAFSTVQNFEKTIGLLKNSSIEIPWLNPNITHPYTDLLHIAASWIWAAGGDFINNIGTEVAFDSPKAIEGLSMWLDTYRAIPEDYKQLGWEDCYDLFQKGRVVATVTDIQHANMLINAEKGSFPYQEHLGIATLTNVPWTGSDNFVIWGHVHGYYERELAALELVKFLVSKESNLRWSRECGQMPARADALQEMYPIGHLLREPINLISENGRAYYNIPLWRRIQHELSQALGTAVQEAQEDPSRDSASILRIKLEPLARRLNRILSS